MIPNYWIIVICIVIFIILGISIFLNKYYKKHKNNIIIPRKYIKVKRIINTPLIEKERRREATTASISPPEIIKLKELLTEFIENNTKWDCLIAIGNIYRKGAFPRFLPNETLGIECYKLASMCPNGNIAGLAQGLYIEARTESINEEDKKGEQFPTEYGVKACDLALERIRNTPYSTFEKPKMQKPTITRPQRYDAIFEIDDYNYDFNENNFNNLDINNLFRHDAEIQINTNIAFKSDRQNVHDHSVVSIAKKNLEHISQNNSQVSTSIEKIRKSILDNEDMSDKQVSDALLVLDKLGTTKNSSFGMSEQDVLSNVWSKISNEKDNVLKKNLEETLGKQLASGVENGDVVCSTGKIVRMLGTFDGIEDENIESTKPLWALREELATSAANIREQHINNLNNVQKLSYDRGEMPELEDKMKKNFRETAEALYCEKLKMNKNIINPIIQMYEEAF